MQFATQQLYALWKSRHKLGRLRRRHTRLLGSRSSEVQIADRSTASRQTQV